MRSQLAGQRTAKSNQIRGLVAGYDLVAPRSLPQLRKVLPDCLEDEDYGLTDRFRWLLAGLPKTSGKVDRCVNELDAEIEAIATAHPAAQRLQQLRGVGPVIATALLATLGNATVFTNGRAFVGSLGRTPRQHNSGGREELLGISKRGDRYLHKLLVHWACSILYRAKDKNDPLSRWAMGLSNRRHVNVATVALANKTARMAWAMMRDNVDYDPAKASGLVVSP